MSLHDRFNYVIKTFTINIHCQPPPTVDKEEFSNINIKIHVPKPTCFVKNLLLLSKTVCVLYHIFFLPYIRKYFLFCKEDKMDTTLVKWYIFKNLSKGFVSGMSIYREYDTNYVFKQTAS